MKKIVLLSVCSFFLLHAGYSQHLVKNVILMIPDGTSVPVLSLSRWYQFGACPADNCRLAIDPHLCGLVRTHNSDSPIGDSAPTGSTYATGYLSNSGFVATYPMSSGIKDLTKVEPARVYQPLCTILEAAKFAGKSTGLVVTCHFPHATPADFSAHTPFRDQYDVIAKQMVHNRINYVLGGGTRYLDGKLREDSTDLEKVLIDRNYKVVKDYRSFCNLQETDSLVYGLFAEGGLPYDLDRDPEKVPSLAEMTKKAIRALSQDKDGFFLLIEGSKVDWAAHANDPVGIVSEFLSFDAAVKEAMDFAALDSHTVVVVCPDHGTGGISIGNSHTNHGYDTLSIHDLVGPLRRCNLTASGIAEKIALQPALTKNIFEAATGFCLNPNQVSDLTYAAINERSSALTAAVSRLISENTFIGFTTTGHTGEDVMLGIYHPEGYRLNGHVSNRQVHRYLMEVSGIPDLDLLTSRLFVTDTVVLAGYFTEIRNPIRLASKNAARYPELIIRKNSKSSRYAVIEAYTDYATVFDGKKEPVKIYFGSAATYINNGKGFEHFFLPEMLRTMLEVRL